MLRLEMMESAAWRALPDNARRLLSRLELEHMQHGGAENGNLVCTYDHFAAAGLRRRSIALAIRQAVALGFLAVEVRGHKTSAEFRAPNRYRLTYVHGRRFKKAIDPTDEWRLFTSPEATCEALLKAQDPDRRRRAPTVGPKAALSNRPS